MKVTLSYHSETEVRLHSAMNEAIKSLDKNNRTYLCEYKSWAVKSTVLLEAKRRLQGACKQRIVFDDTRQFGAPQVYFWLSYVQCWMDFV